MKVFITLLAVALVCIGQPVTADTQAEDKKVLIEKILAQTGQSAIAVSDQFSTAFIKNMTAVLKQGKPDIDPRAFDILAEEVEALLYEEIVVNKNLFKMIYPIYDRHFTLDELEEIVKINETPVGKKMIRLMPMIVQEGMQAGQEFGRTLTPKIQQRIVERFEKEGIE